METQLRSGDQFPSLDLKLVNGGTVRIPEEIQSPYAVLLFHRGHWCRHSMRQLAEYEGMKVELEALGVTIYAISADSLEQAQQVAARGLTFPLAHGMTEEEVAFIGGWWRDDRGGYVQPAEFLIERTGYIFGSLYASGIPSGLTPERAAVWVLRRERQRREAEQSVGIIR